MIRPLIPMALLSAALIAGCGGGEASSDILDDGTWQVSFDRAFTTLTLGEGDPVTTDVSTQLIADVVDSALSQGEGATYCAYDPDDQSGPAYPNLCTYQGPIASMVFDGGQLYAEHPGGTLIGPASALELWGNQNVYGEEAVSWEPPEATPTEGEADPPEETPTPGESPTPSATPTPEPGELSCSRVIYNWLYGQLSERDSAHVLVRVTDRATCRDASGVLVPAAGSTFFFEGEGDLVRTGD